MSPIRTLLLSLLLPVSGLAQEAAPAPPVKPAAEEKTAIKDPKDPAAQPAKPVVEKIDATHYRVGLVTFDKTTREIRLPATVNMIEGALEFLLVHSRGKIHESLFVTELSATHLNLAFTLLRYQPSQELYATDSPAEHEPGKEFPKVPEEVKAAARIDIKVEWTDEAGKVKSVPVNEWIAHAVTEKQMPATPWVYGGSSFANGRFAAETSGDLIAIFPSNTALINYPGVDAADDEAWLPFPKRVLPVGTKVTLVITPNTVSQPTPRKP